MTYDGRLLPQACCIARPDPDFPPQPRHHHIRRLHRRDTGEAQDAVAEAVKARSMRALFPVMPIRPATPSPPANPPSQIPR
jgi:hypothetical protein